MKNTLFKPIVLALGALWLVLSTMVFATPDAGPNSPQDAWLWLANIPDWMLGVLVAAMFVLLIGTGLLVFHLVRQSVPRKRTVSATLGASAVAGFLVAFLAADAWHTYLAEKMLALPPTAAGRPIPDLLVDPSPEKAASRPQLPPAALIAKSGRERHANVNLQAIEEPTLALRLFDDLDVVAVRDRVVEVQGGKVWVGHIEEDSDSEVILAAKGNTLTGTVSTDGRLFEILFVNGNTHAVREIDLTQLPAEDPSEAPDTAGDTGASGLTDLGAGDTSTGQVVDVMVVYTPKVRTNAGGDSAIQSRILNAASAANQGYLNSNIDIALNLIYLGAVDYVETNSMPTSHSRLRSSTDGYMDLVHPLRDQYGADVVILLTADTDYCGYAYVMRTVSTAFATNAFGVVRDGCLTAGSFAHEIGHIMGNAHNPEDASSAGAYPDSYGYRVCGKFRDIMSYSCSGEPRVNYFSNPDIYYSSWPTGILGSNDTARSMNVTSPAVASFRASATGLPEPTVPSDPSNLQASVTGSDTISLSWSDNAIDEVGYRVQSSTDGATWYEIATLAANATTFVDDGLTPGHTYHYRVMAFNSVGNSAFSNLASATLAAAAVDATPPAVKINSPANGAEISKNITVTLSATDNVAVTGLKLYIDNKLVSSTTSSSLSYSWNIKKVSSGSHSLRADAIDAAGNLGTTSITVTKK